MKFFSWIVAILAVILMIFGLITFLKQGAFLGVRHALNYFHVASSMLLLAIWLYFQGHCKKKE